MRRVVIPELLDTDSGTPTEVATALSDLRHINQWFGGIGATQSMIAAVAQKTGASSLSMLEVAAGAGYVPQAASARLRESGIKLNVTLLDRADSHLKKRFSKWGLSCSRRCARASFRGRKFRFSQLLPVRSSSGTAGGRAVCQRRFARMPHRSGN